MIDAFGNIQNVLVVGGNSDIGFSILREINKDHTLRKVVLLVRNQESGNQTADKLRSMYKEINISVQVLDLSDSSEVASVAPKLFDNAQFDLVVLSAGILPSNNDVISNFSQITKLVNVNFVSQMAIGSHALEHFLKFGRGTLVLISSVAIERARVDNYLYGSTKSALDFWFYGLSDSNKNSKIRLLTVRPGMVRTKLTIGMKEAPFTVDPDQVGKAVYKNLHKGPKIVWVPGKLRFIMAIIKQLPRKLFVKISEVKN